ncbi:MAG: hypothetical protein WCB90_05155 [Methanosarcina sp.]
MEDVDKKELSERDICTKFITPAIKQANWRERQIREEVKLTNGRIIVKGSTTSRGKPKRADYEAQKQNKRLFRDRIQRISLFSKIEH